MYESRVTYTPEQARKWTTQFMCEAKPIPIEGWTETRRVLKIDDRYYPIEGLHHAVIQNLSRMGFEPETITVRITIEKES